MQLGNLTIHAARLRQGYGEASRGVGFLPRTKACVEIFMKILTDLTLMKKKRQPVVLAMGFFDGVHKGHRKVIDRTVAAAKETGGQAWVLTFDAHPAKILKPGSEPPLLSSNRHKMKLLGRLNLDGCLLVPFTRELADLDPADFVDRLRVSIPALAEILVGRNWRFGRKGKGNAASLMKLGREMNLRISLISPALRKGEIISSTRVRAEISRGDFKEAAVMLGRPFSILGTVAGGRTLGRKLGFPTANLVSHNEVLPPFGVYAVRAVLSKGQRANGREQLFDGVLNFGVRPTFGKANGGKPTLELYLLDFNRSIYGHDVEVIFAKKIRNEQKFSSEKDLKKRIGKDVEIAAELLA